MDAGGLDVFPLGVFPSILPCLTDKRLDGSPIFGCTRFRRLGAILAAACAVRDGQRVLLDGCGPGQRLARSVSVKLSPRERR